MVEVCGRGQGGEDGAGSYRSGGIVVTAGGRALEEGGGRPVAKAETGTALPRRGAFCAAGARGAELRFEPGAQGIGAPRLAGDVVAHVDHRGRLRVRGEECVEAGYSVRFRRRNGE